MRLHELVSSARQHIELTRVTDELDRKMTRFWDRFISAAKQAEPDFKLRDLRTEPDQSLAEEWTQTVLAKLAPKETKDSLRGSTLRLRLLEMFREQSPRTQWTLIFKDMEKTHGHLIAETRDDYDEYLRHKEAKAADRLYEADIPSTLQRFARAVRDVADPKAYVRHHPQEGDHSYVRSTRKVSPIIPVHLAFDELRSECDRLPRGKQIRSMAGEIVAVIDKNQATLERAHTQFRRDQPTERF